MREEGDGGLGVDGRGANPEGGVRRKELVGAVPVELSSNTGLTVQAKEERRRDIKN